MNTKQKNRKLHKLKEIYNQCEQKAAFDFRFPYSVIAIFTNPFYFVRKNLYRNIKRLSPFLRGKLLDFGCGCKPYRDILIYCTDYVGLDIEESGHGHENEQIDVFYDGKTIPFENEYFDSVFSSEVFEHVINFEEILPELNRVLKKDGVMVATVPFVWNEHEIPYDFQRFTSYGIRKKLEEAGFKVIKIVKSSSYTEILFQMHMEYLRHTFSQHIKKRTLYEMFQICFIMPIALLGSVVCALLPKNYSLYGDNVILCKKTGE